MKLLCKLFVLFMVATLCHWAFASFVGPWGISVNIMLAFAVAFCTVLKPAWGYPMTFLCGLFLDFFSTKLFGAHAFVFTLGAFGIYSIEQRFDFDSFLPQAAVVFVWTIAAACLNSLLGILLAARVFWAGIASIVSGALIGACIAPIIFWMVQKILRPGAPSHLR